ncbi:hypothetical protein C8F01DRAFT_268507 [Mycena amicta]|nr:hypothetical protein C8F01DRAFT_268507 [Mycena amicta]
MPVYQPLRERYIAPDLHYAQSKGLDIQEVPRTNPNAPKELIPYLYLASTTPSTLLPTAVDRPWTHVVRLLPSTKAHPVGSAELIPPSKAGPHILDIRVPAEAFVCAVGMKTRTRRKQETRETEKRKPLHEYPPAQSLLVARDFLALALPYYASAHPLPSPSFASASAACGGWPMSSTGGWTPTTSDSDSDSGSSSSSSTISSPIQADPVAVLLLGPPQLTLALALVYIAYASGQAVRVVVRGILESEATEEWVVQGMIAGEDGLERR